MDSRQTRRKYRIRTIKNILLAAQEQNKRISREKLISDMSLRSGLARRTILEYFQVLINLDEAHYEREVDGEIVILLGRDKNKTMDLEIQTLLNSAAKKEAKETLDETK